jgi:AcrR family transcriptional regulator
MTLAKTDGVTGFTLDAVAHLAGLSKGGLLHHFKSKEQLLEALIALLVEKFERAMRTLADADSERVGRFTRAFLHAVAEPAVAQDSQVLLAAVALNPELLKPLRESQQRCFALFANDGLDPVSAHILALAADALWLQSIFGLPGPGKSACVAIRERLLVLTRGDEQPPKRARLARDARKKNRKKAA